jgi:putative transposase
MNLGGVGSLLEAIARCTLTLAGVLNTMVLYSMIRHRRSRSLAAENLFLRKPLALFQERDVRPRRADDATRAALVWLSKAYA